MLNWFKDLFSESSDVSMTRFLSFVCVITSTIIAFIGVVTGADVTGLCGTFLAAGITGKVAQRFAESKEYVASETPTVNVAVEQKAKD